MSFSLKPASDYTHTELAVLFNRGFEDYFMPINFDEQHFTAFVARDGIDLVLSRVLVDDDQTIGLGMIAKRGESSRLAAMGIARDWRNRGAGTWLLKYLMNEANQRGEKKMGLEVIFQNEPAVHLYEKFGFKKIRQLFGFLAKEPAGKADDAFETCDIHLLIENAKLDCLPNLPWQVDVEAVRHNAETTFGFRLNDSYIATTNPEGEQVFIRILVSKQQNEAQKLLNALFAAHPGKTWHVPAIFPEEQAPIFENVGMEKQEISQWQMLAGL